MENKHLYLHTPLISIPAFDIPGKTIHYKMDALQPCGSFKLRGVECTFRDALANGAQKFLSSSGGNAGLAVAYTGWRLGWPVTVALPTNAAPETIAKLRDWYHAEVVLEGEAWDETNQYCLSLVEKDPTIAYIPPFDHPKLWEGHATLVDELKQDMDEQPDLVITSVGGGGLLNGIVEGLVRNGWEDTHVLAVETIGADSLNAAYEADELVTLNAITSLAHSLGAKRVSATALENTKQHHVKPIRVTDARAVDACLRFADEARVLVEPACGATLSVVLDKLDVLAPYHNIVVEVCGGASVTLNSLSEWKAEFNL